MPLAPDLFAGAEPRFQRFEALFRIHARLGSLLNRLLDDEGDKIKVRHGADRILSLLIGPALGKTMKTFQAVQRLSLLGFGEDAVVLIRSNVNLFINVAFILADPEPNERAADFVAYSYHEWEKYMTAANGGVPPPGHPLFERQELDRRARSWATFTIKQRAERVPLYHYVTGYKFYSSIEHSDAVALVGYISDWDEDGRHIASGPSDSHVEIALQHNLMVMAEMLDRVCCYYHIDRPDIFAEVDALFKGFPSERSGGSTSVTDIERLP